MPDNRQTGALEDVLQDVTTDGDPLLPHAEDSAATAKELGARFASTAVRKAVRHTWLACQKKPGRPYGMATKARHCFGATCCRRSVPHQIQASVRCRSQRVKEDGVLRREGQRTLGKGGNVTFS